MKFPAFSGLLVLVALTGLAGCGTSSQDDLQQWTKATRNSVAPKVVPVEEPKRFVPKAYGSETAMAPFSNEKLASASGGEDRARTGGTALLAPELARRKEPLEAVPLDTMTMVGTLDKNGQMVALVKVDSLLYQVRPGNYLGQNYGRILRITEGEIALREIVQDGVGEWIERAAALQLQEGSK